MIGNSKTNHCPLPFEERKDAMLNHIYKVVWNRTRASWQVVSELANNNGRAKSLRRQNRRERKNQSGIVNYESENCPLTQGKYRKKHIVKALRVCSLVLMLHSVYTVPAYAALSLTETAPDTDDININEKFSYTIGVGDDKTTYSSNSQSSGGSYTIPITLDSGSTWRPLDSTSSLSAMNLVMNSGSTIDLAYKYSAGNNYTEDNVPTGRKFWEITTTGSRMPARKLTITNGSFGDNITFRLNLGTKNSQLKSDGTYAASKGYSDAVYLSSPTLINTDPEATVNVNVEYILNKNFGAGNTTNFSWDTVTDKMLKGKVAGIFGIYDTNIDKFNVTGTATNQVDGALNKYIISTELKLDEEDTSNGTIYKDYSVYWTAQQQDFLSQGAYSAANAALSTRNLWRIEDGLFWKRGDDRRFTDRSIAQDDFSDRESVWANTWRGKYSYDGVQDSRFGQTYSGIQVGYDKLRDRDLFGGKVYTGLFVSKMTSDADFYAQNTGDVTYNSGKGDLNSTSFGAYMLWAGNKGHYLDTMLRWGNIDNSYTYTDSFGDSYQKDFTAKTYGLGIRYGLRIDKGNGWHVEPQVGISYGVMRSFDFRLTNGLKYAQDKMDMLIGRAGLSVSKSYGGGNRAGEAYIKLSANHDFMNGGHAMMYAMQNSSTSSLNEVVLDSQRVDTLAGKDTWYDVTLGGRFKLGGSRDGWLEVNKSFGGKVNTDWQVNGGIAWRWGGPTKRKQAGSVNAELPYPLPNITAMSTTAMNTAQAGTAAGTGDPGNLPASEAYSPSAAATADNAHNSANTSEPIATGGIAAGTDRTVVQQPGELEEFTLAPLVIEAARPDWEKKLSPGTSSVIDVPKYTGEQKTLADLLQTVPGVYIDKLSGGGTGHYTTVRIRGSSASQVNIYMDGVLINTGSEAAVNLENLNIDNVERIEVYRGYIPARFAGAAMGGAINIVTKKPDKTNGKVSYGLRSFGGQKLNLETTSPLGDGSLLLAANHEEATGDFKYYKPYVSYNNDSLTYPRDRWRQNNGYKDNNILAKWQDDNWFVKLNYIDNKTHTPQAVGSYLADLPEQYWPASFSTVQRTMQGSTVDTEKTELSFGRRQHTGNVEWGWKLGAIHQNKKASWMRYGNGNRDFVFGGNTFRNDIYNASIDGTWKMGESHLLEFLATASKETMKVKFDADQYSSTAWKTSFENLFLPKYDLSNYYFQLQDTMKLDDSGSLTFTPLVRAQKSDIGIDVKDGAGWLYSYNLSLKKKWSDQWTTWATYGTYHRLPSWYEVFGDGVNLVSKWYEFNSVSKWSPETYAEHGKNWDIAVNRTGKLFGTDNDTTLTYFHRASKNLLTTVFNPLTGATWYANYGAGNIRGVELSNNMHWKKFDFVLSATWQDSKITKGYTPYRNMSNAAWEGQPFPWTPEWTFNARLDYRFPGDKFSVFGEYNWTDDLSWYNGSGERAYYEAMGLFNIGMKYSFDKQFKLIGGINDIANKGPKQKYMYENLSSSGMIGNVAYPQQGRTYYMTIEYSF